MTDIGELAFSECSGLTSITMMPNSVTSIGTSAFSDCSGLTSITIPNSVTSIGLSIFKNCSGLTSIIVSNGNSKYDSRNNCNAIIETSSNTLIEGCKNTIIPNGVTSIGKSAFSYCSGLTSITIPNSVTSIGKSAFSDCSGLTSITIPNSVSSIGSAAFGCCSGLTSITIPNSVTSIGDYAFYDCSGLTSITIPNSVTSIGFSPFEGCSGLTSIIVSSGNSQYDSRDNCNAIIETSSNTLIAGCNNTIIPNGVTSIGKSAFSYCSGLTSIMIPNSITRIGERAFSHCSSLTSITIPNSVTNIGIYAFSNCSGLASVISEIQKPFLISITVFDEISSDATLQVPKGTKDKYSEYSGWRINFKEIIEQEEDIIYTLLVKAIGNGSVSFDGTTIRSNTGSFAVNEGTNATIKFNPDNGYRIKSVIVNSSDVTSYVSNNSYTISNIKGNAIVEVEFEAIPATTYSLSIKATGNGSVSYNGTTIRSKTSSFTVNEGTNATITFTPDNGYRIKSVSVNSSDVSSYVSNNSYTISNIKSNTTVEVEFEEKPQSFTYNGVNYSVVSYNDYTVRVSQGSYGTVLEVPAQISYQNAEWTVTGIDNGALANNPDLAAIIWNPSVNFTFSVDNPNLLLYVKSASYAPSSIKNVVVNGSANSITLIDENSGNNFFCPQEFTAKAISYMHNYSMITGIGESKGWETIALPFDVQKITHSSKGEIVPFANWKSGDSKKPFWLMELSSGGFAEANAIKANTPYIISMPNNTRYKNEFRLNGNVTFSADNVKVRKSDDLHYGYSEDKTFIPNFGNQERSDAYVLNVNNGYVSYNGDSPGSHFYYNLRSLHPFEAYMTSSSKTRAIAIQDNMTTGIRDINEIWNGNVVRIYNLSGQMLMIEENKNLDEIKQLLSAGVYIVNGKKLIIK